MAAMAWIISWQFMGWPASPSTLAVQVPNERTCAVRLPGWLAAVRQRLRAAPPANARRRARRWQHAGASSAGARGKGLTQVLLLARCHSGLHSRRSRERVSFGPSGDRRRGMRACRTTSPVARGAVGVKLVRFSKSRISPYPAIQLERCARAGFTTHRSSSGPGTTTSVPRHGRRSGPVRSWDREEKRGGTWMVLSAWGCEAFRVTRHWRGCWRKATGYQTLRTCHG